MRLAERERRLEGVRELLLIGEGDFRLRALGERTLLCLLLGDLEVLRRGTGERDTFLRVERERERERDLCRLSGGDFDFFIGAGLLQDAAGDFDGLFSSTDLSTLKI